MEGRHISAHKKETDYVMGVDIGSRNMAMCVYSIKQNRLVWLCLLDLQAYAPAHNSSELTKRLKEYFDKRQKLFDKCDKIFIEGQTETRYQRSNMYLQSAWEGRFGDKCVTQNSREMSSFMDKYLGEDFVNELTREIPKDKRRRKKKKAEELAMRFLSHRVEDKQRFDALVLKRRNHSKYMKTEAGREEVARVQEDLERNIDSISENHSRKNKKWSATPRAKYDDVDDALLISIMGALKMCKQCENPDDADVNDSSAVAELIESRLLYVAVPSVVKTIPTELDKYISLSKPKLFAQKRKKRRIITVEAKSPIDGKRARVVLDLT